MKDEFREAVREIHDLHVKVANMQNKNDHVQNNTIQQASYLNNTQSSEKVNGDCVFQPSKEDTHKQQCVSVPANRQNELKLGLQQNSSCPGCFQQIMCSVGPHRRQHHSKGKRDQKNQQQ